MQVSSTIIAMQVVISDTIYHTGMHYDVLFGADVWEVADVPYSRIGTNHSSPGE